MKMLRRWGAVWALGMAAGAAGTACGGSVSGGSARAELENHAEAHCGAACQTMVDCDPQRFSGGDPGSCACLCPACPVGVTDCACPPCDCGSPPPSTVDPLQQCTADCQGAVADLLKDEPDCDDEMLAAMQCLEGMSCTDVKPCSAQQDALEDCRRQYTSDAPPVGDPSYPGAPGGVTCQIGFGGGSAGPPAPGTIVCNHGWEGCSDGQQYTITCLLQPDGTMACQCLVSKQTMATFVTTQCSDSMADANAACGWNLN